MKLRSREELGGYIDLFRDGKLTVFATERSIDKIIYESTGNGDITTKISNYRDNTSGGGLTYGAAILPHKEDEKVKYTLIIDNRAIHQLETVNLLIVMDAAIAVIPDIYKLHKSIDEKMKEALEYDMSQIIEDYLNIFRISISSIYESIGSIITNSQNDSDDFVKLSDIDDELSKTLSGNVADVLEEVKVKNMLPKEFVDIAFKVFKEKNGVESKYDVITTPLVSFNAPTYMIYTDAIKRYINGEDISEYSGKDITLPN